MKTIVLAAGQGFNLDGFNKLLLINPKNGKPIIENYIEIFHKTDIKFVLGYKAIEVMQRYPDLNYIYNHDWKITGNSYSLFLANPSEECYVVSSDLFIEKRFIENLNNFNKNCVVTKNTDNRSSTALNCEVDGSDKVTSIYQGPIKREGDLESFGIFKIVDVELLKLWKRNCFENSNLYIGNNLPLNRSPVFSFSGDGYHLEEINTVMDYIRVLEDRRKYDS